MDPRRSVSTPIHDQDIKRPQKVEISDSPVAKPILPKPTVEEVEDEDESAAINPLPSTWPYDWANLILADTGPDDNMTDYSSDSDQEGTPSSDSEKDGGENERGDNDEGSGDDGDDGCDGPDAENNDRRDTSWKARQPPSIEAARLALHDLNAILKPK